MSNAALILLGVVLPAIALAIELSTRICSQAFFDPLPTIGHIIVFSMIPIINVSAVITIRKNILRKPALWGWLLSFSIGASIYYSLIFLPILPISIIAVLALGLGFCSLSPIASTVASINLWYKLKRLVKDNTLSIKLFGKPFKGIIVAFVLLTLLPIQISLTTIGINWATSDDPTSVLRGIEILRKYGDENELLRRCYTRNHETVDITNYILKNSTVGPTEVREIFYKVTGKPFTSISPQQLQEFDRGMLNETFDEENMLVNNDIVLKTSSLDGSIDADGLVAYTEWTFEFHNDSARQLEARSKIKLPEGSVVSRLTLWVDGEPREAAFAKRSKVKAAYEKVVSRKRDPVLITLDAKDEIFMQCFPLPPSGIFKCRIGFTSPLSLQDLNKPSLKLPIIIDRNYQPPENGHSIWYESKQKLISQHIPDETNEKNVHTLRGNITHSLMSKARIEMPLETLPMQSWAMDPMVQEFITVQNVVKAKKPDIQKGVFVIDGSVGMESVINNFSKILSKLPSSIDWKVVVAADTVKSFENISDAQTFLDEYHPLGGTDNISAIVQAWELLQGTSQGAILWVHGTRPVVLGNAEQINQRYRRKPDGPHFYSIQIGDGINKTNATLNEVPYQSAFIPGSSELETWLKNMFSKWSGAQSHWTLEYSRMPKDTFEAIDGAVQTSDHITRLWAALESCRLQMDEKTMTEGIDLAVTYQLVTPLTGAVVLENDEQYEENGLEPVEPGTVPTIPEPDIWILLILLLTILCLWNHYYPFKRKR